MGRFEIEHGNFQHGKSHTKIHNTWLRMKARCYNVNTPCYSKYGGRGIRICERWKKFENFLADMGEPPAVRHSIDRIDNNLNYSCGKPFKCGQCDSNDWPSNCRWATNKEQCANRRTSLQLTYKGETKCLKVWVELLRLNYARTLYRIQKLGWSAETAFETPSLRPRIKG